MAPAVPGLRARGREPAPVVRDVQHDLVAQIGEGERGRTRPGVLAYVRERPLGDPQQRRLDPVGEGDGHPVDVQPYVQGRLGGRPCRQCPQGLGQAAARRQLGGREIVDEAAGLGEVALGDRLGRTDVAAGRRRVGLPQPLGRLEQHLLARQALRERVVDLHGEALALGERALAPLGGGQFAPGAEQVVDEVALPVRLALHMDEDGGGDRRDGGRRHHQVRVDPLGQHQLRGHHERGQQGHQHQRGPRRQCPQPGVEQRHRAPREARREHHEHHPHRHHHPEPAEPPGGRP